jgi:glyoxylase-like metal-dependent hydrolase (beta-lactamase superfamily II)
MNPIRTAGALNAALGAALLCLTPLAAQAQNAPAAAPAPAPAAAPVRELTQVAGAVWRFRNNAHYGLVMVTAKGAIVVDPISTEASAWLRDELARRFNGLKVVKVVYSHHDWDHASGAAAFGTVPILSRAETVAALQPPADPAARERFARQFADVLPPTETYAGPVTRVVLDGHVMELHAQPTRHATDLSYVWFPAEKILFTVDVISPGRLPYRDLPEYDEADVKQTLDSALAYNATYVVGGHGAVATPQSISELAGYYAALRAAVADGIAKGLSLDAIKQSVTMDDYRDWGDYTAFRAMNVEGMYRYLTAKRG